MAKDSFIDIFDLCWNAILMESKNFSNVLFSEKHCTTDETRDMNFDLVENRLAYIYKFGCFNAVFVEKCVSSFLDKYPEGEKLFLKDDLKVCSLSNGPGLDLVGLLCGICNSNRNLKSLPVFKTINLYHSWWNICYKIFTSVFQTASVSSNDSVNIPQEIIHFIQCDIYSTLSSDVQECIKDSDMLLMMKVFASTKATSDVVIKTMKEIFSLLKPGSFMFYVGSKKNTKELTTDTFLSRFVNCILGPVKISIGVLSFNNAVIENVSVKPKKSGYAYFIVWQKKDSVSLEDIPKKKRKRNKKKSKQTELPDNTISKQMTDDTDGSSDSLISSHSKQSNTLADEFGSASSEKFQSISPVEINSQNLGKEEHNLSAENLLSSLDNVTYLDKIHINSEEENLTAIKGVPESGKENICNLENNFQEKNCMIKEAVVIQTKNEGDLLNEVNKEQTVQVLLTKVPFEPVSQLVEESNFCKKANIKPLLTHHLNTEQHVMQKYVLPVEENSTYLPAKSTVPDKSSNKEKSVQTNILSSNETILNLKKNIEAKKSKRHITTQTDSICYPSNVQQAERGKTIANYVANYPDLKEDIFDKASMSTSSNKESSINSLHEIMLRTIAQNMNDKNTLPKLKIDRVINKSGSGIIPEIKSHENSLDFKINTKFKEKTSEINGRNKDLNSLLQCCETLVTSLEKLTANFEKKMSLNNDQDTRCCIRKSCSKFRIQHACVNSCCFNYVHSHCCRKVCNCHMLHHTTYAACPKHFHEGVEPKLNIRMHSGN